MNLAENGDDRIIAVCRSSPILSLTVLRGLDHVNIACERCSHFRASPVVAPAGDLVQCKDGSGYCR